MKDKETVIASKFLSLILRHEPERVGLKLGDAGWVGVDELLQAVNSHGVSLTLDELKHIVATSDKKRFAFSEDGLRIRASQGHPFSRRHPSARSKEDAAPRCSLVGGDESHAPGRRAPRQAGVADDSRG